MTFPVAKRRRATRHVSQALRRNCGWSQPERAFRAYDEHLMSPLIGPLIGVRFTRLQRITPSASAA